MFIFPCFFSPCFFSPSLQLFSICSPFNLPILIYCLNFYTIHQGCTIWGCNNDGKPNDDDDDDDDDYENNNLSAFQCDFDQLFFSAYSSVCVFFLYVSWLR